MAYLSAQDAKIIASENQSISGSFMRLDTDRIMDQISRLAHQGEFKMDMAFGLHKVIKARLEHLGYKVKITSDQRDGDWTEVTW